MEIRAYSGWRPRSMRAAKNGAPGDKGGKRNRVGNRHDRAVYKNCKNPNDPHYVRLCAKVDALNGIKR